MINFIAPRGQTFGMEEYLQQAGRVVQGKIVVRTYDWLLKAPTLPSGPCVFAGIDQLTATERVVVARAWDMLSALEPAPRLLNDPRRVMHRYELLTTLAGLGRNCFRVFRAGNLPADLRYPVFIRLEHEHTGNLTPLLGDRVAVRGAVRRLGLRGFRRRDLLVVEYCDTSEEAGLRRKYSAFIVGERVVPCHVIFSTNWMTKSAGRVVDEDMAKEEFHYVRCNPHAEWLRETFALARIEYGRIDYGMRGSEPQVWEVNLNPTLGRRLGRPSSMTEEQRQLRAPTREHVAAEFAAAWTALGAAPALGATPSLAVTRNEWRHLRAERRARRRIEAHRALLERLANIAGVRVLHRAWQRIRHV